MLLNGAKSCEINDPHRTNLIADVVATHLIGNLSATFDL